MRTTYYSNKQEKRWASRLGGRVSPGSGASARCKGDVTSEHFKVECKTTTKETYALKHATLLKIENEAKKVAKHFMLTVEFSNHRRELVIVDRNLLGIMPEVTGIVLCENLQYPLEPRVDTWVLKFGDREYLVFPEIRFESIFDCWND